MSFPPPTGLPNEHAHAPASLSDGLNSSTRKRGLSHPDGPANANGLGGAPGMANLSPPVGFGGGLPGQPPPRPTGARGPVPLVNPNQRNWSPFSLVNEGHISSQQADMFFNLSV